MGVFEWSQLSHYPTLRLRYGEAMTIKEIADHLGVSESTVKRRIARELEMYREERPEVINAYARLHKLEITLTWVNDLTRFGVLIRSFASRRLTPGQVEAESATTQRQGRRHIAAPLSCCQAVQNRPEGSTARRAAECAPLVETRQGES